MAEKEYIERDTIYRRVKERTNHYGKPTIDYESGVKVLNLIKQEPAADVVEVVKCKNCRHGKQIDTTKPPYKYYRSDCIICECEEVVGDEPMVYFPNHFCSYGERKEQK